MTQSKAAQRDRQALLAKINAIRTAYAESSSAWQNFLVYGGFGTGKTTLATTCPTPVFIDCFDKGGTKTAALQDLIKKGDIIVENKWEQDSWQRPVAFGEWEREMFKREREGFFEFIGTYYLDSVTSWAGSMMYEILKKGDKSGSRTGQKPQLQDYLTQKMTAVDWIGRMMNYPCHVVVTGHIGTDKDEVTGKIETSLLLANRVASELPNLFDEKYVAVAAKGGKYSLLTQNDGYYQAETRMGGGTFKEHEEPDIRALLKKAGKNYDNRPSFYEEEGSNG